MSDKNKGIVWLIIALFIAQSIFGFSSQTSHESGSLSLQFAQWFVPFLEIDTAQFLIRKLAHLIIYTALGFSIFRSMSFLVNEKHHLWLYCFLFIIAYAALDEFHQLFVNGRSGEIRDILIDSCGGFLGIQLSLWLRKRF